MHVHILTKVWEQKWGDWKTHIVLHGFPCFYVTMYRGQTEMGSQMDINTYTDACTHSNPCVGPEVV